MANFSERYGYTTASQVIIREQLPEPIINSILNWLDETQVDLQYAYRDHNEDIYNVDGYKEIIVSVRKDFLNEHLRSKDLISDPIHSYFQNPDAEWFEKLDLLEFMLPKMESLIKEPRLDEFTSLLVYSKCELTVKKDKITIK